MNLIRHPYWSEPSSWEGAHFQNITLVKTSTSTDHVSKKLNTVDIFSAVHQKLNMFYYLFQHYLTPPSYNHSSFWIVRPPAKISTFLYPIQPHTYIYTYIYIYMSSPIYCDPRKVPLETPCRDCPLMSFMQKGFHQRNEEEIPTQGTIQWCSVLFRANSFCSLLFPSPPGLNTSQQIQLIYSQLGLTS